MKQTELPDMPTKPKRVPFSGLNTAEGGEVIDFDPERGFKWPMPESRSRKKPSTMATAVRRFFRL